MKKTSPISISRVRKKVEISVVLSIGKYRQLAMAAIYIEIISAGSGLSNENEVQFVKNCFRTLP